MANDGEDKKGLRYWIFKKELGCQVKFGSEIVGMFAKMLLQCGLSSIYNNNNNNNNK